MTPRLRTLTSGLRIILYCVGFPILEEQEVEAAHFVGTVVRAIARTHAPVVDHVVQAFGGVLRRADRANTSQGAFSHCMQGTGWKNALGLSRSP